MPAPHNVNPPIAAVLFDMGGVLVELGPLHELLGVDIEPSVFWPKWLESRAVRRFECGLDGAETFAAGLVDEFQLEFSSAEVLDRFQRFPRGMFPGAASLVTAVGERMTTGVLSNTNALHWENQADGETIRGLFDHELLSYRLGLVKPDRPIFERALIELGLTPAEVLFLDDNQVNVDGAASTGIRAHRVLGPREAGAVLVNYGVIEAF